MRESAPEAEPAPAPPGVEILSSTPAHAYPDEWYGMAAAEHFWMRTRHDVLVRALERLGFRDRADARAIDVGGGAGTVRADIERSFPFAVDLADLNLGALRGARPGRGRSMYYDVTTRDPGLVGRYDLVLLLDVLEHVDPPVPFLRAVADHLAPSGVLVVNVPAQRWLWSDYDPAVGHHRRYTLASLRREAEPAGLGAVDIRYWGFSFVPLLLARRALLALRGPERVIDAGFRPPGRFANVAVRAWMRAETAVLRRPPVGTSVLAAFRRHSSGA